MFWKRNEKEELKDKLFVSASIEIQTLKSKFTR